MPCLHAIFGSAYGTKMWSLCQPHAPFTQSWHPLWIHPSSQILALQRSYGLCCTSASLRVNPGHRLWGIIWAEHRVSKVLSTGGLGTRPTIGNPMLPLPRADCWGELLTPVKLLAVATIG